MNIITPQTKLFPLEGENTNAVSHRRPTSVDTVDIHFWGP